MLVLLPLWSLVLLFLIAWQGQRSWREAWLSSLVAWGLILTLITEIFSLFHFLQTGWLTVMWLMASVTLSIFYFRHFRLKQHKHFNEQSPTEAKKSQLSDFTPVQLLLLIGMALVTGLLGLIAIVAAPNHSDSMEYHLSRVVHWIQNHSVVHYPTHDIFQLYQNPWSEFAITHFQLLSGSDRFANLIQWGSMVSSLVGVSLIASRLGANRWGQILASVFCATIPMGILQASSTNNDYVVAFWLVCFAYFSLSVMQDGLTVSNTSLLGASLGLAILTKGTAYIYAFPFCIVLAIWGVKTLRWKVWQPLVYVLAIAFFLNLGHYIRNIEVFASPLGAAAGETNQDFTVAIFVGSILKNLAFHADLVRNLGLDGILPSTNGIVEKGIKLVHAALGLDIHDPRTLNPKVSRFYVPGLSLYEDTAGNPLHFFVIAIASIVFAINSKLRKQPYLIIYLLTVLAGFLLFCFLFTWSPWRCRLHLPLFVLFSSFVGVVISKSFHHRIAAFLAIALLLLAHPWIFRNETRPLIGSHNIFVVPRIEQYFATQPSLKEPYFDAVHAIATQRCSNVGLVLKGSSFEYPLWQVFTQQGYSPRIEHIRVENESARQANQAPFKQFDPCAVISVRMQNGQRKVEVLPP